MFSSFVSYIDSLSGEKPKRVHESKLSSQKERDNLIESVVMFALPAANC